MARTLLEERDMTDLDILETSIGRVQTLLAMAVADQSPLAIATALDAVNAVGGELRSAEKRVRDDGDRHGLAMVQQFMHQAARKLRALLPAAALL